MLSIEAIRGVWKSELDGRAEFADTLEELLQKLAPDAPPEYVWNAAEVLGAILGAEVVEVPREINWSHFAEQFLNDPDYDWQPTEAQQAYFENERTAEVDQFVVEDDGA